MQRTAGILMPISSLPSPYGIGTIGKAAFRFADFLKKSGQKYWQILPAGPTSYGDSPYQSFSSYAGNPYFIDLDILREEGLLTKKEIADCDWGDNKNQIDYEKIYNSRFKVLKTAFGRFCGKNSKEEFSAFCKKNARWLNNYALFMALKENFSMKAWNEWEDEEIRLHKPKAVKRYEKELRREIEFWKFTQFKFYEQWDSFKKYVNESGIKIIGDMPIYVAMDSSDTWANPEVFQLDEKGFPTAVAGCPPDYFSPTGQLWGNPLYNWDYLKETNYRWWFARIKSAVRLYDVVRIDHFRGFDEYYSIPYPAENAVIGSWEKGPGIEFFKKMKASIGGKPIIAEDLGHMTDSVIELLKESGYPGMKVLEFAFDGNSANPYLPHNYQSDNCVVYTGTHDNDTVIGWAQELSAESEQYVRSYCKMRKNANIAWGLIKTAYQSRAAYAIVQMQDVLGLGSHARINTPSTLGNNWTWRADSKIYSEALAKKLFTLTENAGRC